MLAEDKIDVGLNTALDRAIDILKLDAPNKEQLGQERQAIALLGTLSRYSATKNARISLMIRANVITKADVKAMRKNLMRIPELKLMA